MSTPRPLLPLLLLLLFLLVSEVQGGTLRGQETITISSQSHQTNLRSFSKSKKIVQNIGIDNDDSQDVPNMVFIRTDEQNAKDLDAETTVMGTEKAATEGETTLEPTPPPQPVANKEVSTSVEGSPNESQVLAEHRKEIEDSKASIAEENKKLDQLEMNEEKNHVFCHSEDPTNCIEPVKWSSIDFETAFYKEQAAGKKIHMENVAIAKAKKYVLQSPNTGCAPGAEIKSIRECKEAASVVGKGDQKIAFNGAWLTDHNVPAGCVTGEGVLQFNDDMSSTKTRDTLSPICHVQFEDWPGDQKFDPNFSDRTIPRNMAVVLDVPEVNVKRLYILGILVVEDKHDVAINAEVIMVHGVFRAGYAKRPFQHQLTITLTGEPTKDDIVDPDTGETLTNALGHSMGTKVIGVMAKGDEVTDKWCNSNAEGKSECSDHAVLELHGKYEKIKPTWTTLGKSAKKGDTSITMKEKVQWSTGDEIVIAGTSWLDSKTSKQEKATIASVSQDGTQLKLTRPLAFDHYGELQSYAKGRILDERAEVGLLSRNIVIQGDESTKTSYFGGHVMIMEGAVARIEGVELRDVGQARLGR